MNAKFNLKKNNEIKFTGSENECYMQLQKMQSQSADWATKYEGWSVEEVNENKEVTDITTPEDITSVTREEAEANTKLIAAAPDMLEALKEIAEMKSYIFFDKHQDSMDLDDVIKIAQNAINKATL